MTNSASPPSPKFPTWEEITRNFPRTPEGYVRYLSDYDQPLLAEPSQPLLLNDTSCLSLPPSQSLDHVRHFNIDHTDSWQSALEHWASLGFAPLYGQPCLHWTEARVLVDYKNPDTRTFSVFLEDFPWHPLSPLLLSLSILDPKAGTWRVWQNKPTFVATEEALVYILKSDSLNLDDHSQVWGEFYIYDRVLFEETEANFNLLELLNDIEHCVTGLQQSSDEDYDRLSNFVFPTAQQIAKLYRHVFMDYPEDLTPFESDFLHPWHRSAPSLPPPTSTTIFPTPSPPFLPPQSVEITSPTLPPTLNASFVTPSTTLAPPSATCSRCKGSHKVRNCLQPRPKGKVPVTSNYVPSYIDAAHHGYQHQQPLVVHPPPLLRRPLPHHQPWHY